MVRRMNAPWFDKKLDKYVMKIFELLKENFLSCIVLKKWKMEPPARDGKHRTRHAANYRGCQEKWKDCIGSFKDWWCHSLDSPWQSFDKTSSTDRVQTQSLLKPKRMSLRSGSNIVIAMNIGIIFLKLRKLHGKLRRFIQKEKSNS